MVMAHACKAAASSRAATTNWDNCKTLLRLYNYITIALSTLFHRCRSNC